MDADSSDSDKESLNSESDDENFLFYAYIYKQIMESQREENTISNINKPELNT